MCSQIPYKEEINMKANRITQGKIYLLNNLFPAYPSDRPVPEKHNYIVISKEPKTDIGMVQVMEICSLRNREPIAEVPIVLENDYISYVIPYNIYSVRVKEILNRGVFKGCIWDQPEVSVMDFIKMLHLIYTDFLDLGDREIHSKAIKMYQDYCAIFNINYGHNLRYRDFSETPVSMCRQSESGGYEKTTTTTKVKKKSNKVVIKETKKKERRFNNGKFTGYSYEDNMDRLDTLREMFAEKRPEEFAEYVPCEETAGNETETVYSDNLTVGNTIQIPAELLIQKDTAVPDTVEKICDATKVSKTDKSMLERFQELPRVVKKWSDDDLRLWYNASRRYTTKILMMYCHQFRNEQALWNRTYCIKKEMLRRSIL